ncbi:MAG: hypothetical protein WCE54_10935 [Ignavibacteriaceae bacterium]
MKLPDILLITLFIFSIGICKAHPGADKKENENIASQYKIMSGADIKAMVQIQIDSARARDFRGEIKSCLYYADNSQEQIYSNENAVTETKPKPVIEIKPEVFLLVVFSISVLIFVFARRFINNRKLSITLPEQEVINISRKEETSNNETDDLEQLRIKLNPSIPGIKESSLPSNTKGMKIAKGEVILAAKIRSYQLAHFGNK